MHERSSSSVRVFYPELGRAEIIQRLGERLTHLAKRLPVVRAVLFGSYATGRYMVGSDIDLLIVYEGEARPEAYALVKKTIDLPRLEPHLYTESEHERLRETIGKMTAGGVVLMGRERSGAPGDSKRPTYPT